jgi:hypothetical protein
MVVVWEVDVRQIMAAVVLLLLHSVSTKKTKKKSKKQVKEGQLWVWGCTAEVGMMGVYMVDRVGMSDSLVNMVAKGEKERRGLS